MLLANHRVANSVLVLPEITEIYIYVLFLADKALITSEEDKMHNYY